VLLSPFIAPGTTSATEYNHFSGLASFESMFGLARLGEAQNVPQTFGPDVFTDPTAECTTSDPLPWQRCDGS
jgi:hypothetical protein